MNWRELLAKGNNHVALVWLGISVFCMLGQSIAAKLSVGGSRSVWPTLLWGIAAVITLIVAAVIFLLGLRHYDD